MAGDDARVPAAAPGHMERAMMRLLNEVQKAADGSIPTRVCGLTVVFSFAGDADVTWDIRPPSNEPTT
ncbi:hypothetical protein [Belnapia sp. F-4-1]|uniref:hypothetical protein n=1 Tax=Belnapia sp. F-4-1 TaxID=1545443 RepID=UPI0005BCB960|nr:hypothetical protein [Belnapia sp. F-4-1]